MDPEIDSGPNFCCSSQVPRSGCRKYCLFFAIVLFLEAILVGAALMSFIAGKQQSCTSMSTQVPPTTTLSSTEITTPDATSTGNTGSTTKSPNVPTTETVTGTTRITHIPYYHWEMAQAVLLFVMDNCMVYTNKINLIQRLTWFLR